MIAPMIPPIVPSPKRDTIKPTIIERIRKTTRIAKILTIPTLLMSLIASPIFKTAPKLSVSANLQIAIKNANPNMMNNIVQ